MSFRIVYAIERNGISMRASRICPECKSPDVTCQIPRQMVGLIQIEHWMCRDCGLMMQYKRKRSKKDGKY